MKLVPVWVALLWRYIWSRGSTNHVETKPQLIVPTLEPSPEMTRLYETLYAQENQAREAISTRLQIPLAIAVSLLTAQGYLFFAAAPPELNFSSATFVTSLLVGFGLAFLAGIVFFRISSGHRYKYVPTPAALELYRAESELHFKDEPGGGRYLAHWVNVTMNAEVFRHYVECTTVNGTLNAERSEAIFSVHRLLLVSIFFTLAAFVAFVLGDLKDKPIHRAQIQLVEQVGPNLPVRVVEGLRAKPEQFHAGFADDDRAARVGLAEILWSTTRVKIVQGIRGTANQLYTGPVVDYERTR